MYFFSRLVLPVSITDKSLTTRYQSAIPVTADPAQMSLAIGSYIYPEPDMRLSGMELYAGYVFYAEDESSLHRLNEELEDANDMLALENELLEHEQELIEERAARLHSATTGIRRSILSPKRAACCICGARRRKQAEP